MPVQSVKPDTPIAEITAILQRDGAVIIEDLIAPDVADGIVGEIVPHLTTDGRTNGPLEAAAPGTQRVSSLIARSPKFRPLVTHSKILDIMDVFFDHVTNYQLGGAQYIQLNPGAAPQTVHQDQWAYDFFDFPADYEVQCNLMWALNDYTEENGATRIIVGSHRLDNFRHFHDSDTEPVEMRKGSALVYSGRIYHGGGTCKASIRHGISVNYTAGWLRAQENQHLGISPELARTLPIELLWLVGYSRGAFFVNYFDTDRDPIEALFPDAAERGMAAMPERVKRQMAKRWKQFEGA